MGGDELCHLLRSALASGGRSTTQGQGFSGRASPRWASCADITAPVMPSGRHRHAGASSASAKMAAAVRVAMAAGTWSWNAPLTSAPVQQWRCYRRARTVVVHHHLAPLGQSLPQRCSPDALGWGPPKPFSVAGVAARWSGHVHMRSSRISALARARWRAPRTRIFCPLESDSSAGSTNRIPHPRAQVGHYRCHWRELHAQRPLRLGRASSRWSSTATRRSLATGWVAQFFVRGC